jgi:anti-sigma regulatory factor (Ser/Thr protein kinase)
MINATVERARSERARSVALRKRSEQLAQRLVDALRNSGTPLLDLSDDRFSLRLARIRPAVALLRYSLARWLEPRGVGADHVRDLTLAASEACENAVEHPIAARGAFEVEAVCRDDEVVIVVRDSGGWRPESASEARRRGLRLIRSLMTEVEVVRSDGGTEIVMRRRLD